MRRLLTGSLVFVALATGVGCSPPKKAPKDLSDLTWYLYREWPDTEAQPLEDGVANLRDFLAPIAAAGDLTGDTGNRSWQPAPPQKTDITQIPWPEGKDPAKCTGISVAWKSPWPITDHARLQIQTDQLLGEPTAKSYTRHFKSNPFDCFPNHSCLELDTYNDIVRANPTMEVQLPLFKNMRWVKLKTDKEDRWAIVSRSWIDHSVNGKDPKTGIDQSASLDVWLSISDTETWRYQAVFSESRPEYPADLQSAVVRDATDNTVQAADSAIKKLFH
jgi:hypothetical protein